jgi:hypothetical protein
LRCLSWGIIEEALIVIEIEKRSLLCFGEELVI